MEREAFLEDLAPNSSSPATPFALASLTLVIISIVVLCVVVLGLKMFAPKSPTAQLILNKLEIFFHGFKVFFLSKDKKFKYPEDSDRLLLTMSPSDPAVASNKITNVKTKTIVFIRHGESEWNEVFNRGFGPSFLIRLIKAIFREIMMIPTRNSLFIDSELSEAGINDVLKLRTFLKDSKASSGENATASPILDLLRGLTSDAVTRSVIVCSNLRRAIQTATIALQDRVSKTNEKIQIMTSLQEISRNVDANALASPHEIPDLSGTENYMPKTWTPEDYYNVDMNFGDKGVNTNGLKRMLEFNKWVFEQEKDVVIVGGGHSLYFKSFFIAFLPKAFVHECKKKKIVNGGTVAFQLQRAQIPGRDEPVYRIIPESLDVIYGGFTSK